MIISISHLPCEAVIGTKHEEKTTIQPLMLHLQFSYDAQKACLSDRLEDAVDYSQLAEDVQIYIRQSRFQLLESLLFHLKQHIETHYPITSLHITIDKPHALTQGALVSISS